MRVWREHLVFVNFLCYSDFITSGRGGVVPRQSHKLQAPVQFGAAQQLSRGSSVGKSVAFITPRSWVQLPPSTHGTSWNITLFCVRIACVRTSRCKSGKVCGSSSIWLERVPVTDEVAGSSPVSRAIRDVRGQKPLFVLVCLGFFPVQVPYIVLPSQDTSLGWVRAIPRL